MKQFIFVSALTLLIVGAVAVPHVNAENTTTTTSATSAMLEQIKALMTKLEELQKQLSSIRGEIKEVIRNGIAEGVEGDDVKKIQELLATDPSIYPQGKITGYYGPLTKDAIKRFQEKHGLEVTGIIDDETKDLLEEYLHEGFGEKIPQGLLRAPGIMKKVEARFLQGCEKRGKGHAMGPLCKRLKNASSTDDKDDDSEDEDNEFEVEVEIENGTTTVSFKFDGKEYDVTVESVSTTKIIEAVADELDVDVWELNRDLKWEIKKELIDEIEDEEEDDSDEDEDE